MRLAALLLLVCSLLPGQHITFSLQSHGETCDQIGKACKRLSLWTATVTNDKTDTLMIAKPALLAELVKIGVAARDDQSAARVVLHREKRGGWRIVGRAVEELLYGCSTATLPENPYIASGCGLTALFGPRTVERAAGLEPQVGRALTEVLGTQFLELAPDATGVLVLFSTRYSGEATYEVALSGGRSVPASSTTPRGDSLAFARLQDGRELNDLKVEDATPPPNLTSTPRPAKAWEIPAGTWLPVGHYWGPCAEWRGHVERF